MSFIAAMSQWRFTIVGVDATDEMLQKAKRHPFKKLICSPLDTVEFNEKFDIIGNLASNDGPPLTCSVHRRPGFYRKHRRPV